MNAPLLLTNSPSPCLQPSADSSFNKAPPILHINTFGPCQGAPVRTPLLKSRRQAGYMPPNSAGCWLPFTTTTGSTHQRSPLSNHRRLFLLQTSIPSPEDDHYSSSFFLENNDNRRGYDTVPEVSPLIKTFLPSSRISPLGGGFSSSDSITSLSPLSPLTPVSPVFTNQRQSSTTFQNAPLSHTSLSTSQNAPLSQSSLRKSQSTLIMPNIFSLLRQESTSPTPVHQQENRRAENVSSSKMSREASFMSLKDTSSPSPLIRKCHTMISLSNSQGAASQTSTKLAKEKSQRLSIFRRISSSKSAVFSSGNQPQVLNTLPSSTYALQSYRKNSIMPHAEQYEDGELDLFMSNSNLDRSGNIEENIWNSRKVCSRCNSLSSLTSRGQSTNVSDSVFCKLCLTEVSMRESYQLQQCQCRFCTYCIHMYTTLKIREGEASVECPDSNCYCSGELTLEEIESLVGKELLSFHLKIKKEREVNLDPFKTWCPKPGCDTVVFLSSSKIDGRPNCSFCPTCKTYFCASCSLPWHPSTPCVRHFTDYEIPLNECIKRCPRCKVPIERDAGCAQMQCKKCKHVFCWYCLASLEDDFLLRHYDKGPCKNKLGHSRASVLLHRTQVIAIFAGFCLLMAIVSPLFLVIGPCILCRSCRSFCKADSEDDVSSV